LTGRRNTDAESLGHPGHTPRAADGWGSGPRCGHHRATDGEQPGRDRLPPGDPATSALGIG